MMRLTLLLMISFALLCKADVMSNSSSCRTPLPRDDADCVDGAYIFASSIAVDGDFPVVAPVIVEGDFVLELRGVIQFSVNKKRPNLIDIGGCATLRGSLQLVFEFTPEPGATFAVLRAACVQDEVAQVWASFSFTNDTCYSIEATAASVSSANGTTTSIIVSPVVTDRCPGNEFWTRKRIVACAIGWTILALMVVVVIVMNRSKGSGQGTPLKWPRQKTDDPLDITLS